MKNRETLINDLLEYILEFEENDFRYEDLDGPRRDHIFMKALEAKHGRKCAEKYFQDVLKKRGE